MSHPASCKDPDCKLSYAQHLNFYVSAAAMESRYPHEANSIRTEKRWHRDHEAYKTLYKQGYEPRQIDGAACLAANAKTDFDVNHGEVKVDWSDYK